MQTLGGGEVQGLTEILYEAREKALARIELDAEQCGADEVVGVKTNIYDLGGGLIEFMAIGTAVKRIEGAKTKSSNLPPQAVIQDRETFVDASDSRATTVSVTKSSAASARRTQGGPLGIIVFIFVVIFYLLRIFGHH